MTGRDPLADTLESFIALPIPARPFVDEIVKQARVDGRVQEIVVDQTLHVTELELLTCTVFVFSETPTATTAAAGVLVVHRTASDMDGAAYAAALPSGDGRGTRFRSEVAWHTACDDWVMVLSAPLAAAAIGVRSGLFIRKYACCMSLDRRGDLYFGAPCEVCGVIVHRQNETETDEDLAARTTLVRSPGGVVCAQAK